MVWACRCNLWPASVLLGRPPEGFDVAPADLDKILPPVVGGGLPSELRDADLPEPDEDFWRRQRQAIMRRVRASGVPSGRVSTRRWRLVAAAATVVIALTATHTVLVRRVPSGAHSIEWLDDDALRHLHELLPMITPASTIEDADSDLLAVHDLGDDDLDALADLLDGSS